MRRLPWRLFRVLLGHTASELVDVPFEALQLEGHDQDVGEDDGEHDAVRGRDVFLRGGQANTSLRSRRRPSSRLAPSSNRYSVYARTGNATCAMQYVTRIQPWKRGPCSVKTWGWK